MFSKRYKVNGEPRPPYVTVEGCEAPQIVRDERGRMLPGFRNVGGGVYALAGKEAE